MSKFIDKYTYETAKKYVEQFGCKLLSENYFGMNEKHKFQCKCGNEFETTFAKFQNRNKHQCNKCGRQKRADSDKLNIIDIAEYANLYGCTLLSDTYTGCKIPLKFKCKCGNTFEMSFTNFKLGKHQCQKCSCKDANESKCKYTYENVYDLVKEHNGLLLTPKTSKYITRKSNLLIKCECGDVFATSLFMLLDYNKFTCNVCSFKNAPSSKGEIKIRKYLDYRNIKFKEQYSFDDCKNKYVLRFDFAIFDEYKNISLIEFDGVQHFKSFEFYGGEKTYLEILKRDNIKNKYCLDNNIKILRIPYFKYDNIEHIIDNYLIA